MTSDSGTLLRAVKPSLWLAATWLLLLLAGYGSGRLITEGRPGWDASAVAELRGGTHGTLTALMRNITDLGSPLTLNVVFTIGMSVLLVRRQWRAAVFLLLASPASVVLVQILKSAVNRSRPTGQLVAASGASWPSGHASNSLALYGGLLVIGLVLLGWGRWRRRLAIILTAVLVVLIGLSRVYLAVHFPTDVCAAWALVACWLAVLTRTVYPLMMGKEDRGREQLTAA